MEKTNKFEFIANKIDSIGIDIIGIFRLLRSIPRIPKIEMIIENVKDFWGSVSGTWNVRQRMSNSIWDSALFFGQKDQQAANPDLKLSQEERPEGDYTHPRFAYSDSASASPRTVTVPEHAPELTGTIIHDGPERCFFSRLDMKPSFSTQPIAGKSRFK